MLKFYYNPISVNARRVWVTLLEKSIPFEAILMNFRWRSVQPRFYGHQPTATSPRAGG